MTTAPAPSPDTTIEAQLREAIHAYVFQPQPGANRTVAYNNQRVEARMREEHDPANARIVGRLTELVSPPARVLEVGSGTGGLASAIAALGFEVDGLEPDRNGLDAARLRALRYPDRKLRFSEGVAERIPFPDSSFDCVISTQVLEHVADRLTGLRELFRVTKPGGVSLHLMPNYAYPFEPHYRLPYPPRVSKQVGEIYLRALGRDVTLLQETIFPTFPREMVSKFERVGFVEVENRYAAEVLAKLNGGPIRTPVVRRGFEILTRMGALRLLKRVVLGLELYPSIVIIARRPPEHGF